MGDHRPWWWCCSPSSGKQGWGNIAPRQDASWPWYGQDRGRASACHSLLYQRGFLKLCKTESGSKIPHRPWVPKMDSDALCLGLINTGMNWSPLEALDCSLDKYSFLKCQHQALLCGIWTFFLNLKVGRNETSSSWASIGTQVLIHLDLEEVMMHECQCCIHISAAILRFFFFFFTFGLKTYNKPTWFHWRWWFEW